MDLDEKTKPGGIGPKPNDPDGSRKKVSVDDDSVGDVEFDLIDDPDGEDTQNDVFSRDTAIPASPPEHLAAEAMRKMDASERRRPQLNGKDKPRLPPPPPMQKEQPLAPVTIEPLSSDMEFDNFDAPIDVFGQRLPGTERQESVPGPRRKESVPGPRRKESVPGGRSRESVPGPRRKESAPGGRRKESAPGARHKESPPRRDFGQSEMPTAPPAAAAPWALLDKSRRSSPAPGRAQRPAFLAETSRNRPFDADLLARATLPGDSAARGRALPVSEPHPDSALDFVDGLDPLLDSLSPMAGLKSPVPPSVVPSGNAKDLQECYAVGDYSRALQIAEELLARSPDDLSARRHAQNCRDALTQMFTARIGPLDQVISVVVTPEEVQWLSLDHRAGFLLSLVDGQSTVDEILDISGMTRLDALKIIHDLVEQQVVRLG
jgi:hypothetical protein